MDLRELMEQRSGQPPASVRHHLRLAGVRQKVATRRRRRLVAGVAATALAVAVIGIGGTALTGTERSMPPAGTIDGFPEYRDGNRVVAATSGSLADEQELELTFVPSTAEPVIYWRCDLRPSRWAEITSTALPGLYISEVEVRVNGRVLTTRSGGTMCGTPRDEFSPPDVDDWVEAFDLRIGEATTVTVTLDGPFTEIDGRTPVEVPRRAEWGIAAGEPVPFEEYVFPPRPDPLPGLQVPEHGSHVLLVRSGSDPSRPVHLPLDRRPGRGYTIQVGAQTPGHLTVLVDGLEAARVEVWDHGQRCQGGASLDWSDLREAGLEALPGDEVTVTVRPEHMTGEWYVRLNSLGAIHC